jgi:hypothetical protein
MSLDGWYMEILVLIKKEDCRNIKPGGGGGALPVIIVVMM